MTAGDQLQEEFRLVANQKDQSKSAVNKSMVLGKIASIFGIVIVFFFAMAGFGVASLKICDSIPIYLVFIAFGVFLIIKGKLIKDRIKRFKNYIRIITVDYKTNINDIANSTGKTVDFVKKGIQVMIDKKFFLNAYIDKSTNQIVLNKRSDEAVIPQNSSNANTITG